MVDRQQKLLLPFLASFYDWAIPFSWFVIRAASGIDLAIHGWEKVERLPRILAAMSSGTVASLPGNFDPAENIALVFFEFIGGICIAVGLFTRVFAAAAAIEMAIISFTVFWSRSGYHGAEYVFYWGIVLFAIALRGSGPYSLDSQIGQEL
ncbi:MAG TPA: DoxX family protein [Stellaceae bacterium]|jgi:putative oxidoreductase|nr:DoxX family protein [Stellaceae bacterium]